MSSTPCHNPVPSRISTTGRAEMLQLEGRRLMSGDPALVLPDALPTAPPTQVPADSHLFQPQSITLGGEHGYFPHVLIDEPSEDVGPAKPAVLRYQQQDYAWGDFGVYDAMRRNPGNLEDGTFGMHGLHVSYGEIYAKDANGDLIRTHADEGRIRATARRVSDAGVKWVLDIEHWPTDIRREGEAAVRETMDKMLQIVEWAKDERPDVEVGFYGIMPLRDYWTPNELRSRRDQWLDAVANRPGRAEYFQGLYAEALDKYQRWQQANDFLKPLAAAVDFVVPSLYTFYDNPTGWDAYATANLTEAARYDKPVLPFLWPQYHNSNREIGLQHVPADLWRHQLELTKALADGVAIWRAFDPVSDTLGWWQETLAFVADLEQDDDES